MRLSLADLYRFLVTLDRRPHTRTPGVERDRPRHPSAQARYKFRSCNPALHQYLPKGRTCDEFASFLNDCAPINAKRLYICTAEAHWTYVHCCTDFRPFGYPNLDTLSETPGTAAVNQLRNSYASRIPGMNHGKRLCMAFISMLLKQAIKHIEFKEGYT